MIYTGISIISNWSFLLFVHMTKNVFLIFCIKCMVSKNHHINHSETQTVMENICKHYFCFTYDNIFLAR